MSDRRSEHPFFSVQTGEVRSRGIELEGQARVWKQLDVIAAYTYLDTTVQADTDPTVVGKRVAAVPRISRRFGWTMRLSGRGCAGLRVGGGALCGAQRGDNVNTFDVPAVVLVDLGLSYDLGVGRSAWKEMARCGACE